jgi:hypothetical protein
MSLKLETWGISKEKGSQWVTKVCVQVCVKVYRCVCRCLSVCRCVNIGVNCVSVRVSVYSVCACKVVSACVCRCEQCMCMHKVVSTCVLLCQQRLQTNSEGTWGTGDMSS